MVAALEPTRLRYNPVGSARDVMLAKEPEVVAAGPAGTGKTLAICHKCHLAAVNYPNARILLTRKELESLKPAALTTFVNGVQPHYDGVVTFGGNRFTPAEFRYPNGSVVQVTGLDRAEKVKSAEYDLIFVNEITEIPEDTYEMLKSRLRNGRMPYQQVIGDCNPAGPRHWLLQRHRDGRLRLIESTHRDNPAYWDARANTWTPLGLSYVEQTLGDLSGVQRDRLYLGKWVAAEGLVYPEFELHMIRAVDTTGWRTVMAADIGSRNPTAILTGHVAGDERIHISREVYRRNMTSTDIVTAICEEADRANPDAIWIDPSAKGVILDLERLGYPVVAASNDVLDGIRRVRSVLVRGFTVDPDCINLIDEFGMYAYPTNTRTDTDKPAKEHDHAMDALRYLCMGATEPFTDLAEFYESMVAA